jgi:hypothetical protein
MPNADLAQLVEQLICNQQVNGSNPLIGSNEKPTASRGCGLFLSETPAIMTYF